MDFSRNSNLIHNPLLVKVKSARHNNILSAFTEIYGSPSKIRFNNQGRSNAAGIFYTNTVSLIYPGLSPEDFTNFNELLQDEYHLDIVTDTKERIRVGWIDSEMKLTTKYTIETGHTLEFKNISVMPLQYLGLDSEYVEEVNVDGTTIRRWVYLDSSPFVTLDGAQLKFVS